MSRALVIVLTAIAGLASVANPHFLGGGAHDVYGLSPRWPATAAVLDLAALSIAASVLCRRASMFALSLVAAELLLYLVVVEGSVLAFGNGYFNNGWGRGFFPAFVIAVVSRVLLVSVAYTGRTPARAAAT